MLKCETISKIMKNLCVLAEMFLQDQKLAFVIFAYFCFFSLLALRNIHATNCSYTKILSKIWMLDI